VELLTKFKPTKMKQKLLAGFLAIFAILVFATVGVSAAGEATITELEIDGIETVGTTSVPVNFAGDEVTVRVQFEANEDVEDVRIKSWISGARSDSVVTERFDILEDGTYTRVLAIPVPSDLNDDDLEEDRTLTVIIDSRKDGELDEKEVELVIQRESYRLDILDVDMPNQVRSGDLLILDVVLKNIGRQYADDTFVRASIPGLGVEDRAYFGDLSSVDQPCDDGDSDCENEDRLDRENANERRLAIAIPSNVAAGVYTVEVEAFNEDSATVLTRKVNVVGLSADTQVVSPVYNKNVGAGENAEFSLTIVNTGNQVAVYELVVESTSSKLDVTVDEPVIAVPAGSSRTVNVDAIADSEGQYNFAVNVHSGSELVAKESFSTNVEGTSFGSATVLLTVILAIVFVVLLVVLIVLLTKKPETKEEFSESYY
jgi:methionine-rich copper-binding protein CopC